MGNPENPNISDQRTIMYFKLIAVVLVNFDLLGDETLFGRHKEAPQPNGDAYHNLSKQTNTIQ